jgi:hypothetical protein
VSESVAGGARRYAPLLRVAIVEYGRYQGLMASERELLRTRLQVAAHAASARAAALSDDEVGALIEQARREATEEGRAR